MNAWSVCELYFHYIYKAYETKYRKNRIINRYTSNKYYVACFGQVNWMNWNENVKLST